MKSINEVEFEDVINQDKLSLVCFGASFCGKCRMAQTKIPTYEEALKQQNIDCTIYKIDADECKATFKKYGVEHMPVFILFKKGKNIGTRSALGTPDGIVDFVKVSVKQEENK